MQEPWKGVLATDSQGVLDTLQEEDHDPQEQEVPVDLDRGEVILDCLRPDWDILIEIQSALKQLPRVTLQYVQSGLRGLPRERLNVFPRTRSFKPPRQNRHKSVFRTIVAPRSYHHKTIT